MNWIENITEDEPQLITYVQRKVNPLKKFLTSVNIISSLFINFLIWTLEISPGITQIIIMSRCKHGYP